MIKFSTQIKLLRQEAGSYNNDGVWVNGSEAESQIDACVQPVEFKNVENMPQGEQEKKGIKIFTEFELIALDRNAKKKGDVVEYKDEKYKIIQVSDYTGLRLSHYEAIGERLYD